MQEIRHDLLREDRVFPPSDSFKAQATVADPGIYDRAEQDPEGFWAQAAKDVEKATGFWLPNALVHMEGVRALRGSAEIRDMVIGSGMEKGAALSYDRLEDLVIALQRE